MIVLSYGRYRGYNASYAETRANKREYACACIDTCINHILFHVLYTHTCVYMRMRKHRSRVKAFDAMFVVKDELFSTRRRLLACTWRDKSSWIFRASKWCVWGNIAAKIANVRWIIADPRIIIVAYSRSPRIKCCVLTQGERAIAKFSFR